MALEREATARTWRWEKVQGGRTYKKREEEEREKKKKENEGQVCNVGQATRG